MREEGLYEAMAASLMEAWSLLLHLLHLRQEVLMMASEFYCRASEVSNLPNISVSSLESEASAAAHKNLAAEPASACWIKAFL